MRELLAHVGLADRTADLGASDVQRRTCQRLGVADLGFGRSRISAVSFWSILRSMMIEPRTPFASALSKRTPPRIVTDGGPDAVPLISAG